MLKIEKNKYNLEIYSKMEPEEVLILDLSNVGMEKI